MNDPTNHSQDGRGPAGALREHWPEYLCEAAELGLFMISAGLFTILLHHPRSPVLEFHPQRVRATDANRHRDGQHSDYARLLAAR